ncbi:MAG: PIG-L deacetylase family protein [Myxococcota bacterium]
MPPLQFEPKSRPGEPLRVLCLGAHSDDIEIGCGATLLQLLKSRPDTEVDWVVFTSRAEREKEARAAAMAFLENAGKSRVTVFDFEDGFLPYHGERVKRCFEELKSTCDPDLIFTHYEGDRHQDHRLLNELTWNTFRAHAVFEYEIPKYDGDLGRPTVYVPLSADALDRKVALLLEHYETQRDKHWFDEQTFRALCRIRGMECRSPSGYAEAFYVRKLVVLGNEQ